MKRPKYTARDRERVRALSTTMTIPEVSMKTGIAESTLRLWRRRYDIQFMQPLRGQVEKRALAERLLPECASWQELADRVGVDVSRVRMWGHRYGWDTPGMVGNKFEDYAMRREQAQLLGETMQSWDDVAELIEVDPDTMKWWARKYNWKLGVERQGALSAGDTVCERCTIPGHEKCCSWFNACTDDDYDECMTRYIEASEWDEAEHVSVAVRQTSGSRRLNVVKRDKQRVTVT